MDLALPGEVKPKLRLTVDMTPTKRKVVAVSLGPHVLGHARPKIDPNDPATKVAGCYKRVGRQPPRRQKLALTRIARFTRKFCHKHLTPLSSNTDSSFENFIDNTPYTRERKKYLTQLNFEDHRENTHRGVSGVKCFIKDESYSEYKHARLIMSREDTFKCRYGPLIKQIENEIYKYPAFIKHIPVADRADYISEMLGEDGPYYETDYTAYESQFEAKVMRAIEFVLYDYMTQYLPDHEEFMEMNYSVVGADNQISAHNVKFSVQARMSGEMSTSLGNGFSNLMVMLFVAKSKGCSDVKGVVEGDDGLFTMQGPTPTRNDFADLGFEIKLAKNYYINDCSFCGIVFDDVEKLVVTDPAKVIMNFGWTTRQYLHASDKKLRALLRAKSMSFLAAYPGCPIIQELAVYGIRVTRDIDDRFLRRTIARMKISAYEKQKMYGSTNPIAIPVGDRTRILISDRYGITVDQQIAVETMLRNKNDLSPILLDSQILFHDHTSDYYENYVISFPHREGCFDVPNSSQVIDELATIHDLTIS